MTMNADLLARLQLERVLAALVAARPDNEPLAVVFPCVEAGQLATARALAAALAERDAALRRTSPCVRSPPPELTADAAKDAPACSLALVAVAPSRTLAEAWRALGWVWAGGDEHARARPARSPTRPTARASARPRAGGPARRRPGRRAPTPPTRSSAARRDLAREFAAGRRGR